MSTQRTSARNYTIRFAAASAIYTVAMLIAIPVTKALGDSPWRFLVAALPTVGVALGIWAMWRLVAESDEMQARKLLESLAFSIAGTVLLTFTYGMLEMVGAPHLPLVWVTPVWAIMLGVGSAWVARKYR